MIIVASSAPQSNRTTISTHLKREIAAAKSHAPTAKTTERPAKSTGDPSQLATEKANASATMQIKVLTDLATSLLRAMEEQKRERANQIETLTRTFTQQIS